MRRAIFADRQQAICQTTRPFTTHAIEALAHGLRDSDGHTLSSNARQLLGQTVCFLAFDVQAHGYTNLPTPGTILPDAPGHSISEEFAADPAYGCDRPRRPRGLYGRYRRHAVDPPRRRQDSP